MASEIDEIEAILNNRLRIVVATTGGRIERAVGIDGVRQAAMEIAAHRSKDREDGAREMRGRAAVTAHDPERWKHEWIGQPIYYAIAAAIEALPLTTRTEDGDA